MASFKEHSLMDQTFGMNDNQVHACRQYMLGIVAWVIRFCVHALQKHWLHALTTELLPCLQPR